MEIEKKNENNNLIEIKTDFGSLSINIDFETPKIDLKKFEETIEEKINDLKKEKKINENKQLIIKFYINLMI